MLKIKIILMHGRLEPCHGNATIAAVIADLDEKDKPQQGMIVHYAHKYSGSIYKGGDLKTNIRWSANDFGGERAYIADFEVYDQRANDPSNTSLDIYIRIK